MRKQETKKILDQIAVALKGCDESGRMHLFLSMLSEGRIAETFPEDPWMQEWCKRLMNTFDNGSVDDMKSALRACPAKLPKIVAKTIKQIIDVIDLDRRLGYS